MSKPFMELVKEVEQTTHLKKVIAKHAPKEHPSDSEDPKNFEIRAPNPKIPGRAVSEATSDVNDTYIAEVYTLLDEIQQIFPEYAECCARDVATHLRITRDLILERIPSEAEEGDVGGPDAEPTSTKSELDYSMEESYAAGLIKLQDGSSFNLTPKHAVALNKLFEQPSGRRMEKVMLQNHKEMQAVVDFAISLTEEASQ